jgi:hypothetical protein
MSANSENFLKLLRNLSKYQRLLPNTESFYFKGKGHTITGLQGPRGGVEV